MPYRKIFFEENQPFHIVSHAVEERKIFEREEDCYRFIFQIYAANYGTPASNLWKKDVINAAKGLLKGEEVSKNFVTGEHPPLVYILDFSLVVNHYHFYLVPNTENGVPVFMKKLNGGFAKYFNLKHGRKGTLFGSRYKSIPIKSEFQLDAVSRYVSIINPLDVYQPNWREKGLNDLNGAFTFLEDYQFSSFPDKLGKRNSRIIATKEILHRYCSTSNLTKAEYLKFVREFLEQKMFLQTSFLE
ncbi:MAG: hypothetical protein COT33_03170 [Candidatus Nealsonbacteria bacterium CG08_land_8_20_14_0_20_38_20]|uniref:Transposase IS200-like domain-containing protein n=1 Tax=Candidatus Nealsonbacteria bacterium CG08_land_8_20_14_0_20_38_20 TaxID=1974705 RepID=A0A2H0YN52_9BACT|nr:MAG: hypothetical protein COT33_03170 [Candidatus Nealsonbacteria bacterium CG08_land_8_20_14_0_20_38_20]